MSAISKVSAALLIFSATGLGYAQPITWEAYTYNAVASVVSAKGFQDITERIEKQSGGRMVVKFHLGGSLQIKADSITQAVSQNVIQIADDAFFAGTVPIGGLVRLPMLLRDDAEYLKAAKIVEPYVQAQYAKLGVTLLGDYYYPKLTIFSRKPLASLGDLNGQKIRVPSIEYGEFVKRFGAVSVTMAPPEVPSALERGVMDGVVTSSTLGGMTWKDLLNSNYRIGISYPSSNIIVNADALKKLPATLQEVVRKAVLEGTPGITSTLARDEATVTKSLAAGGMKVSEASPKEVAEAEAKMASYWNEWAKQRGPVVVEALKKVRSELKR